MLETMCGGVPKPRYAALRKLRRPADRAVLDEALVLYFPGPASETGEDIAELQIHGGRAVVAAVLAALGSIPGMRAAEPGEFARRALMNGKMDVLDLEALADLIDADTEWQRRQALEGGGGVLRRRADGWRDRLLAIRADLETDIDFSDQSDVTERFDSTAERLIEEMLTEIDQVLEGAHRGERLRDGFRVVLAGRPNAGKSSLMNALAGRDVAIVSATPGTTRDRIDVFLDLNGVPLHLADTAGLQETTDAVEREGIRRSHGAMREADLVLWLSPSDAPSEPEETVHTAPVQIVRTKSDLAGPQDGLPGQTVSIHDRNSVAALLSWLEQMARDGLGGGEPTIVTRDRQRQELERCRAALRRALSVAGCTELAAEEVRVATTSLERLVGRIDVEDVLGAIFSRFCIGK